MYFVCVCFVYLGGLVSCDKLFIFYTRVKILIYLVISSYFANVFQMNVQFITCR